MAKKKILYKPIYRCPLCGVYAQGDGYTKEEVDDILKGFASKRRPPIVQHNCADGDIGVMELLGFTTEDFRDTNSTKADKILLK